MQVIGPDTLLVKKQRREFEVGLCSIRVPERFGNDVAAVLCELLQCQRIEMQPCWHDGDMRRIHVKKVEPDRILGAVSINGALIWCGFGWKEERCPRPPPALVPQSTVRDRCRHF